MKVPNIHELFVLQIKDLHSAETQITEALPKMIEKATTQELSDGFQEHLTQTENQIERLETICESLDIDLAEGHTCKGMKGIIDEGNEIMKMEGDDPQILDTALIAAAQKVEHYEIAAYGTAIELAKQMQHDDEKELLEETLKEEKETDEKLTKVAKTIYEGLPEVEIS